MNTVKYIVPSINCMHCMHTIKTELDEMEGIKSVEADSVTKEVVVQYEPPATPESIEALLADINFPVKK